MSESLYLFQRMLDLRCLEKGLYGLGFSLRYCIRKSDGRTISGSWRIKASMGEGIIGGFLGGFLIFGGGIAKLGLGDIEAD